MAVVVPDVAAKFPFEVPCVENEKMVEALGPDGPNEPLGVGIGVRGAKRRAEHPGASAGEDGVEAFDVLGISVTEEELGLDSLVF
jgi:hypothetical protein